MSKKSDVVEIKTLEYQVSTIRIIGETPLIMHSMGSKEKTLLFPKSRRKSGPRDLLAEWRDCFYRIPDGPTAYGMPATSFKGAMVSAARHVAGVTMTGIRQLVHVVGDRIPIYGIPKAHVCIVRLQDMAKTPDVRVRPIFPRWCAELDVRHLLPHVTSASVAALMANAGAIVGVGDFRPEKGAGSFGTWRLATPDDEDEFKAIMAEGGREAQIEAEQAFEPYDDESAEMLEYWKAEFAARTGEEV